MSALPTPTPSLGFFGDRRPQRSADGRSLPAALRSAPQDVPPLAKMVDAQATLVAGKRRPSGPPPLTAEERLVRRITFGATYGDFQRAKQLGYQAYLEEQLAYEAIDDSSLEGPLRDWLPTLSLSPGEIYRRYGLVSDFGTPVYDLWFATMYRALWSPRQLFESVVHMWTDHFNIDINFDNGWLMKGADDRDVIRKYAMTTFPQLLAASAKSPAMLSYLTNDTNYAEHPNENYARELMELHTLGADNGYTQQDVREVARCFTGWSWSYNGEDDPDLGRFLFYPEVHDDGQKVVLGQVIPPGGGITDAERVIAILASHPNTARFIARKMLRWFWGYDPPQNMIDLVALRYQRTGGDIKGMLRLVLNRSWLEQAPAKLKRPFHLAISALRALYAVPYDPWWLIDQLYQAGQLPFTWSPPNGFPDARPYWAGYLLPRWNFAATAVHEELSAVTLDLSWANPSALPAQNVDAIDLVLSGGHLGGRTRDQLVRFLRRGHRDEQRFREALGIALSSPELQEF